MVAWRALLRDLASVLRRHLRPEKEPDTVAVELVRMIQGIQAQQKRLNKTRDELGDLAQKLKDDAVLLELDRLRALEPKFDKRGYDGCEDDDLMFN